MSSLVLLTTALSCACAVVATTDTATYPVVVDTDVTYKGLYRNDIEVFLNIPYGQDTSGENRFKPPQLHVPTSGSVITAQSYGPACPQWSGEGSWYPPFSLDNYTSVSEDCLNLNIARPSGTAAGANLPVMVYIYGGSLITGQASDSTILPDGIILEAVENGTPVIHVAMNYRLGLFGFAQAPALKAEGSENAGYRDQRLALEWVRDKIGAFGGDGARITVFGQSSGGSSVGAQILAYGGAQPVPFQRAILQSGALDVGVTANYSLDTTQQIIDYVGCNTSADALACLRAIDTDTLTAASLDIYTLNGEVNGGSIWLAAVDGDFLPAAPSELLTTGRFANVTAMLGWTSEDLTIFTDTSITTEEDTYNAVLTSVPDLTAAEVEAILDLYPSSDFTANPAAGLSAEFYRTARFYRDSVFACEAIWYGAHLAAAGNDVYLYEWNQTIFEPIAEYLWQLTGMGVWHESEFSYEFGNLSHYNVSGWPFNPSASDYALARRAPRSFATFATTGVLGEVGCETFQGWEVAFPSAGDETDLFVVGGPDEGLSAFEGADAAPAVAAQKLTERCAYLTSPEIIEKLHW